VTEWRDQVDRLLYDGERVVENVGVGSSRLVVTSHRLLAFTPDEDGANFRAVDIPNVEDVRVATDGNRRYLRWTLRPLLLGGILLLAGSTLDIDDPLSSVDTGGAGETGAGGILSTVSSLTGLLAVLDDVMLAIGALCLLVVALLFGLYLYSRETRFVVGVAGDADVELAGAGDQSAVVTRLETALASTDRSDDDLVEQSGTDPGPPTTETPAVDAGSDSSDGSTAGLPEELRDGRDAGDEGK